MNGEKKSKIYIEYSIKWEKEVYFKQKQMPRSMNIQTENKHVSVAVTNVKKQQFLAVLINKYANANMDIVY